jgi:hypothetical protein
VAVRTSRPVRSCFVFLGFGHSYPRTGTHSHLVRLGVTFDYRLFNRLYCAYNLRGQFHYRSSGHSSLRHFLRHNSLDPQTMFSLLDLPTELVILIGSFVSSPVDRIALRRTCKLLRTVVLPPVRARGQHRPHLVFWTSDLEPALPLPPLPRTHDYHPLLKPLVSFLEDLKRRSAQLIRQPNNTIYQSSSTRRLYSRSQL